MFMGSKATWNGAIAVGQMMPLSSGLCSIAAAGIRDADAVTAHEHWFGLASFVETDSVSRLRCLVPSWKIWLTSDATGDFEGPEPSERALLAYVAQVRRLHRRGLCPS